MGEYGNEGVGADLYLDVVKNSRSRGVDEARGFRTCCYLVEKSCAEASAGHIPAVCPGRKIFPSSDDPNSSWTPKTKITTTTTTILSSRQRQFGNKETCRLKKKKEKKKIF